MPLYTRKVTKSKWCKSGELPPTPVPADAVTLCLKTSSNKLSVWFSEGESDIEKTIAALASNFEKLEKLDVVIIDGEFLEKEGFKIEQSVGNIPSEKLKHLHRDIADLNVDSLGTLARFIGEQFSDKTRLRRIKKDELRELLKTSAAKGLIEPSELKENVQKEVWNS